LQATPKGTPWTRNAIASIVVTKDGTVYLAYGGGVKLPALVVVSPAK
jgi:hypothetical protein